MTSLTVYPVCDITHMYVLIIIILCYHHSSYSLTLVPTNSKCQSAVQLFELVCVRGGVGGTDMEVHVKDESRFLWKDVHLLTSKLSPHFKLKR